MKALARLTAPSSFLEKEYMLEKKGVTSQAETLLDPDPSTDTGFARFAKLPTEVRLMIWLAALPGPRIITHDSKYNTELSLLRISRESRQIVKESYQRLLSPGSKFPQVGSHVLYFDPEIDTVVRDLTWASAGTPDASLFDFEGPAFNLKCFRLFTGLTQVKHLALALDLIHDNGGSFFSHLQTCCPNLETLTLFPHYQLMDFPRVLRSQPHESQQLRFVDLDSNFRNLIELRWDRYRNQDLRTLAFRGMAMLAALYVPVVQYGLLFPDFVKQYGQDWNPQIQIGLLTQWSPECNGWRITSLGRDRYSTGFPGDDGRLHHGFMESEIVCRADGELLSRYDGIEALFTEA
jgi:hypothetical protein